jgi:hypothetical protein
MKIQHISKTCAAVACALTFSASAANIQDASFIAKGYTGDNINHVLGLANGNQQLKAVTPVQKHSANWASLFITKKMSCSSSW